MTDIKRYEIVWGNRPLVIEFNRFANQTDAACTVRYGDTMVLVTVVMSDTVREGIGYFPLMVEYKENMYAAGKISGSRFIKREGRPSDDSVLSGRIIDRSVRPLFDESIRNDIQVMITVLAYDPKNDPDVAGLVGTAAALMVSRIPWNGPLAGCVVAAKNGEFQLNPAVEALEQSDINVFVSGRNMETVMLEADGREAPDALALQAIEFGLKQLEPVITLLQRIQTDIGEEKIMTVIPELSSEEQAIKTAAEAKAEAHFQLEQAKLFGKGNKRERAKRFHEVNKALLDQFLVDDTISRKFAGIKFESLFQAAMIDRIFKESKRVDDRGLDEIRPISVDVALVPRVHGSGMFMRGDTQVLSIATLSSPSNEQILDTMRLDEKRRYFHHYNFPPFSVGEAKPARGPGRREIGHGALAEKALLAVLPSKDQFPYTMRVVSEVMSSNGSSSQGSICGSSLALMDAGVPIKRPVAGIALGIAFQQPMSKANYRILTDVQDVEDHEYSMDFKVAGTTEGITAIQLDIKFDGLTMEMVKETFTKAKTARMYLLEQMTKCIPQPRAELSPFAPRIKIMQIDPEQIGELIGPGGKTINKIIDATGVSIDIEEDGKVFITATDMAAMTKAVELVQGIVKKVAVGEIYTGEVVKIIADRMNPNKQIGAIVSLTANQDGMIHISQLDHYRVEKVTDVVKEGDMVKVQVMEVDRVTGKIALSRKALLDK